MILSNASLYLVDLFLLQDPKKITSLKGGITTLCKRIYSISKFDILADASVKLNKKKPLLNNHSNSKLLKSEEGCSCFVAAAFGKGLMLIKLVSHLDDSESNSELGGISVLLKEVLGLGLEQVKAISWVEDSIIVGTVDGYSIYDVNNGVTAPIFSLPEASGPPHLKFMGRTKEVMLVVDNVGVIVNEHGQPVAGTLVFGNVPASIFEMGCYVIVERDGKLELYSRRSGACVQSLCIKKGSGGKCILAGSENGDMVAVATIDKVFCFRKVHAEEQIKGLLRKKNFMEAIRLMEEFQSEGEMSTEALFFVHAQLGFLLLFELRFEEAVDHFLLSESMQPYEIFPFIIPEPNRWSHLFPEPRNRYWELHPPPVPLERVVDDGLMSIQRAIFLRKAGVETFVDEAFLSNPPTRADLLQSAIENLIRYLCITRGKDWSTPVKEGIDTLLMYLYRALNHVEDMEQLAASPNSCIVEELETLLGDSGHLRTLAFLYACKGMHAKALSIWRLLAKNSSNGLWKDSVLTSEKSAATEASKLLQESSDQDLILEHFGWIAEIDQECAIMVLTSENRVNHLSPEKVLAAVNPKNVEIQQRYLQWLIEDQESDDTQYHTLYALSLAKSTMDALEIDNIKVETCNGKSAIKENTFNVCATYTCHTSTREKLQLFLQASDLYDPEEVLQVIEGSELWFEKAILYRKMGRETLVLQILAWKLEDSEAAEQYCVEIGRNNAYMQLLDLYLNPQDGKAPMFNAAVRLLHNHGESLDPLQVLEKLSPEMPLQLASDTILKILRARVHHYRQGQIVHNLSLAVNLDARSAKLEEKSRHVLINDERTCDSCHSRLGTKLFAMYPDDSVVCYKCYRRQGESVSARGRNFKNGPIFKQGWLVTR